MGEQVSLFVPTQHGEQPAPYPWGPAARATDTSQQAAVDMEPKVDTLRAKALEAIKSAADGLTADEVAAVLGESILAIRPRITELWKLGYLMQTTKRRKNQSGKSAIVWRLA